MASGNPDYTNLTRIEGLYGTTLKTLAVDSSGRLYSLMVGQDGTIVAVDADGNMKALMQGTYGSTLKTVLTDTDGRILAQLMGMYGTTAVPISCDSAGRLTIVGLDQTNISADPNEGQTWDPSLGTLLNNLNRIRYAIVTMSGEAWGTFSHSIATLWAKFNLTTGHAHSGAADDGKQVDHGSTGGLQDDDHARYWDKDGSKAITGTAFFRDVNNSYFNLYGGTVTTGKSPLLSIFGGEFSSYPGQVWLRVPNAAMNGYVYILTVTGVTDTPVINWQGLKLTNIADPASAQDAATRNYVDTSAIAKAGFIILWSGSIASIPAGWVLCNGANSTPDYRDRFVVGAGTTYAVGDTGGEATHALSVAELPIHHHTVPYTSAAPSGGAYAIVGGASSVNSGDTGSGTAHQNMPPYYSSAFIMKT